MKEITTEKPRIDWIDLAKGFCILLVMWWHIKELYSNRGFTDRNDAVYGDVFPHAALLLSVRTVLQDIQRVF